MFLVYSLAPFCTRVECFHNYSRIVSRGQDYYIHSFGKRGSLIFASIWRSMLFLGASNAGYSVIIFAVI